MSMSGKSPAKRNANFRVLVPLMLLLAVSTFAVAIVFSPSVQAQVPPCGSVLLVNTTITGGTCTTPFAYQIGAPGITVHCKAASPTVTGIATSVGIENYGFTGVTIKGCTFSGFDIGILVVNAKSNSITHDVAQNSAGDGFKINDSVGTILTRNTATMNGGDGFDFVASSSFSVLTANSAVDNQGSGFAFNGDAHDVLQYNIAVLNGLDGFILSGASLNTLVRNTASGNSQDGFLLTSGAPNPAGAPTLSNTNILYANQATINKHDGFELIDAQGNILIDNTAKFNVNDGIDLNGGSGVTAQNIMVQNLTLNNLVLERSDTSVGGGTDGTANLWIVDNSVPPAATFPAGLP